MQATSPSPLLVSFRLIRLSFHIVYALGVACIYPVLGVSAQRRFKQGWSLGLLKLLNVQLNSTGLQPSDGPQGRLFVSNHISWLDVFAINATAPGHFVAKSEVAEWPVLGWLVRRSGTLFIRRNLRSDMSRVNQSLVGLLQQGHSAALFAQGTSTDGTQPVHFHAALFQSAIDAQALLYPVAVYYHDRQGERLEALAFIGDTGFFQSLWQIVHVPCTHLTTVYLPALTCAGQDRRSLALQAQQAVNATLATLSRC